MGKLYEKIKKYYDEIVSFQNKQENDYVKETTFKNLYKISEKVNSLNYFLVEINDNKNTYFGNKDNYKEFLANNKDVFAQNHYDLPYAVVQDNGKIDVKSVDYETILNTIEAKLSDDKINLLLDKFEKYNPTISQTFTNPLTPLATDIINDVSSLELTKEESDKIIETINYVNSEIVEKHGENNIDKLIDKISIVRDYESKKYIDEVANEVGTDADKVHELKEDLSSLAFLPETEENKNLLKPFLNNEPVYSDEFKNKIIALDEFITQKGILKNGAVGESGYKEYGFVDYFEKLFEVKDLLVNQTKLVSNEDKINNLREIQTKADELKDVTNKYNEVIDYIKENFDIDKINLNGNIYSGRKRSFENDYKNFRPNFPERWDNENAAFGVILSGYAQLKGAALEANVSIEEYLENPIKSYFKGGKEIFKEEDDKYFLPNTAENSLGKRMANALIMDGKAYQLTYANYVIHSRGIEFLNTTSEIDENSYKNIIKTATGKSLINVFMHTPDNLFVKDGNTDYQSIQNLFALGNDTDRLYEVSTSYFDENVNHSELSQKYDEKIAGMKNVNVVNQTRRVMDTLKDFMVERKRLNIERENEKNSLPLVDTIPPAHLFVGAKKYMNDFIFENKIDLLSLNKKDRKEVMDFLEDPLKAFEKKCKDEPNFFLIDGNTGALKENYNTLREEFKEEYARINKSIGDKFVETFNDLNNKTNGRNANKSILEIIQTNKGGFWENRIGTTSKEYKALESSVLAAFNPESQTYGDLSASKVYAQKYLDHKLPQGVDFEKLSENEKRRIEFCQTIIGADLKMQLDDKTEENKIIYAPDNVEFQKKLQNDVDLGLENNNNIIIDENIIEKENVVAQ